MSDSTPTRSTRIQTLVQHHFEPVFLDIENESYKHQVPTGSESHFKLTVVSEKFKGLHRIERHRCIQELLSEERKTGLHALSLALYTPEEWAQHPQKHATPPCQHS
jgi:BolA protein